MIRKKNRYVRPKKPYELSRIKEENEILKNYGLKNKREIWKMQARVDYFRRRAKALARSSREEQEVFFNKLKSLGLKVDSIADALALSISNILERRLQTVVLKKGLAKTIKEARQLVVHKKVKIDNEVNNTPSYLVPVSEENLLSLRQASNKPKEKKEEVKKQKEENKEIKEEKE